MSVQEYPLQADSPGGINRAVAPHLIADNQGEDVEDFLLDRIGLYRLRGPLRRAKNQAGNDTATFSSAGDPLTLFSCLTPNGLVAVGGARRNGGAEPYFSLNTSTYVTEAPFGNDTNPTYIAAFGTCAPVGEGGIWVYSFGAQDADAHLWYGATKDDYSTGSVSLSRNSTAVTGTGTAWTANASPGMFLYAETDEDDTSLMFAGVVKTVGGDTSITLEEKSLVAGTTETYKLMPFRPPLTCVSTGRLTCTDDAPEVSGGATKFRQQNLGTGSWYLFRERDRAYIGMVDTVVDDDNLTLAANAGVSCTNEDYFAIKQGESLALGSVTQYFGQIVAAYASRQWWLGSNSVGLGQPGYWNRAYFSEINNCDAVDATEGSGDYLTVPMFYSEADSPIIGGIGTFSGLLVFRSTETAIIVGQTSDTFEVRALFDDGLMGLESIVPYKEGILWAGWRGIYYYDGVSVTNIVASTLGDWYVRTMRGHTPFANRVIGFVHRGHYFLRIGAVGTFVINLETGAVSTFSNADFLGATRLPTESDLDTTWFIVGDDTASAVSVICDAEIFFSVNAVDAITCDNKTAGPRPVWTSKVFDMGAPHVKKWFKQFAMTYLAAGTGVTFTTATGLQGSSFSAPTGSPSSFATAAAMARARVKLDRRTEYIRFKIVSATPGSATNLQIGSASWYLKPQRMERW